MVANYPKAFAHKRIYNRIDKAIGHGEPMAGDIGVDDQIVIGLFAVLNDLEVL